MNYANDPYWAHKEWYSPERRQAYENQVMIDRAAQERHRAEFDAVAIAAGAITLGQWFSEAPQRYRRKVRDRYISLYCPKGYEQRKVAFDAAMEQLEADHARVLSELEAERSVASRRLGYGGGTAKQRKSLQERAKAAQAEIDAAGTGYLRDLSALLAEYADILAYESGLATIAALTR